MTIVLRSSVRAIGVAALWAYAFTSPAWAEEWEAALKLLSGNIIKIELLREDETPAKGVKVCLLDPEKKVIAEGKINADGEWSWPAPGPGTYVVLVDPGTGVKDQRRYPIQVKGVVVPAPDPTAAAPKCEHCPAPPSATDEKAAERRPFPWTSTGVALGFVGIFGVLYWFSRGRGRELGQS